MKEELTAEEIRRRREHREAAARQQGEQVRQKQKRDKKSKADARTAAALMRLVSDAQRSEFSQTLSRYEGATVEALIENGQLLENVRARINAIMDDAHRLDDGRAVFKTQDSLAVIDEHGEELRSDEITPEQIFDHLPRWETYREATDERDRLLDERQDLIEFQDKLDDARERLEDDGLTTDELDDLGNELQRAMPTPVRQRLMDENSLRPDLTKSFNRPVRNSESTDRKATPSGPGPE